MVDLGVLCVVVISIRPAAHVVSVVHGGRRGLHDLSGRGVGQIAEHVLCAVVAFPSQPAAGVVRGDGAD